MQIDLRWFINILQFQGGCLLKFFPIFAQKIPKSWLLKEKNDSLFEFCIGGGLIKSEVLTVYDLDFEDTDLYSSSEFYHQIFESP